MRTQLVLLLLAAFMALGGCVRLTHIDISNKTDGKVNLHRLTSLADTKKLKPKALTAEEEANINKRVKRFRKMDGFLYMEYPLTNSTNYEVVLERMVRISLLANKMEHTPDWKLGNDKLTVKLTTRTINDVSEKDYLLAYIIEKVL